MRNPRLFVPGGVHFITFRTEEGLPFVALKFMNILLLSALARAKRLYPVQLIAITAEANHVHMLIRVLDPVAASMFIGYFKTETSNYLNRLLNRRQRTVWLKRFDSPIVVDIQKALEIFGYTTLNPVKDGLVHSMAEYPGVSSYRFLLNGENKVTVKSIPRDAIISLADPTNPITEDSAISDYLSSDEFCDITLTFEPEALRLAYPETKHSAPEDFRAQLLATLASAERNFQDARGGMQPLGVAALITASILAPHTPPITGKKMICLSTFKELRQSVISAFRRVCDRCREVYASWKKGDLSIPYPPGMFAPHPPRLANMLPALIT